MTSPCQASDDDVREALEEYQGHMTRHIAEFTAEYLSRSVQDFREDPSPAMQMAAQERAGEMEGWIYEAQHEP